MAVAPDSSFRKRVTNLDISISFEASSAVGVGFKLSACSPSMQDQFRRLRLIASKHAK
jgi:hypothetical protein